MKLMIKLMVIITKEQVIEYVTKNPGCKSKDIADSLGVSKSQVNRQSEGYPGIYRLNEIRTTKDGLHYLTEETTSDELDTEDGVDIENRVDTEDELNRALTAAFELNNEKDMTDMWVEIQSRVKQNVRSLIANLKQEHEGFIVYLTQSESVLKKQLNVFVKENQQLKSENAVCIMKLDEAQQQLTNIQQAHLHTSKELSDTQQELNELRQELRDAKYELGQKTETLKRLDNRTITFLMFLIFIIVCIPFIQQHTNISLTGVNQ